MDDTRYTETEAVVVIACTAAKGDTAAPAADLYLADRTDVYAMLPAAYLDLLSEALQTIGTYPMDSFESARGIGDQRHVMSHSTNQEDDQR